MAAAKASSFRELAHLMGYSTKSGAIHSKLKRMVAAESISTQHFSRPSATPKYTVASGLKRFPEGANRPGGRVLTRLLLEVGRPHVCACCGIKPVWNGRPLTFQVDHIDGDLWNNLRTNLQFLCPNCHTQTETWGGRNIKKLQPLATDEQVTALRIGNTLNAARVARVSASGIDFSKLGWVTKVSTLLGVTPQYATRWMKRHMPRTYLGAYDRDAVAAQNKVSAKQRAQNLSSTIAMRKADAEREHAEGYGWLSRLARRWGIHRSQARRWVASHAPHLCAAINS